MNKILRTAISLISVSATLLTTAFSSNAAANKPWDKNDDGYYYSASPDGTNMTKAPGVTCRGIDISVHNGDVNWAEIARQYNEGSISFVILRCGYGSDIESQDDKKWERNANACRDYGIPFGVYLYSYALSVESALSEAEHVLRLVKGYTLSYPIYYDFENTKTQSDLSGALVAEMVDTFCQRIQKEGYEVGFYSMRSWITNKNHLGQVDYVNKGYSLWIAEFGPKLNYSGEYDIWQCTSSASVSGSSERTDISFSYIPVRTIDHCYVTFDMNGEDGIAPKAVHAEKGKAAGELPSAVSSTVKVNTGWYTEPVGGELITPDTPIPVNGKLTLYAHWESKIDISVTNAKTSGGSSLQVVTSEKPFENVIIEANEGYYLPSAADMPDGFTYKRITRTTAEISSPSPVDAAIKIAAIPEGTAEPVPASAISIYPASHGGADGKLVISGIKGVEVFSAGEWKQTDASGEVSGLKSGEIKVRRAASDGLLASAETVVLLKERAETPDVSSMKTSVAGATGSATFTVTLPGEGYLYSLDGKSYTSVPAGGKLSGLPIWKQVFIKKAASAEYDESLAAALSTQPITAGREFNYLSCAILTRTPSTDFLVGGETVKSDADGYISIRDDWFGTTLTLIPASMKDDPLASEAVLDVPERPAAPELVIKNETYAGMNDGSISGVKTNMQYSLNGTVWNAVTTAMEENGFPFEYGRTYYFRVVRTGSDSCFTGDVLECKVEAGRKIKVSYMCTTHMVAKLEVKYGETVTVPELPEGAIGWSQDLSGVKIVSDTVVEAVYPEKTGCGACAGLLSLLMPLAVIPAILKKKY